MAKQAQVGGKLAGRLGDTRKGSQNVGVYFPRIGLTRYGHNLCKAHFLCDFFFQQLHFLVVSVEELQKAGLGAGGTLGAQQL